MRRGRRPGFSSSSLPPKGGSHRQLHDLAILDDVTDFGGLRLQQRRADLDVDVLLDRCHAKRDVHGQGAAHLEDHSLRARSEPGKYRVDLPLANLKRVKGESALGVCGTLQRRARGPVFRGDDSSRRDPAGRVADDAEDLAGVRLRRDRRGGAKQQCARHDGQQDASRSGEVVRAHRITLADDAVPFENREPV
jgi:hypothetical protein